MGQRYVWQSITLVSLFSAISIAKLLEQSSPKTSQPLKQQYCQQNEWFYLALHNSTELALYKVGSTTTLRHNWLHAIATLCMRLPCLVLRIFGIVNCRRLSISTTLSFLFGSAGVLSVFTVSCNLFNFFRLSDAILNRRLSANHSNRYKTTIIKHRGTLLF